MTMQSSARRASRRQLGVTSALLVVWSLSGTAALADGVIPGTGTTVSTTHGNPANNATITPLTHGAGAPDTMTVDLNDTATVINWTDFSIGGDNSVVFQRGTGTGTLSVLNRVTGGTASQLDGALTATGIQFWLLNPSGIFIGTGTDTKANINTGAFFASTLDMAPGDFTAATPSYHLTGGSTDIINVNSGATIMTAAGPLVLMGQTISTAGHLEATAGDVALVAGTEMTVQASPLSPLGITVMAGTQVGTAKISVDAHGQLKANSVILAGQADGTHALASDILLGIDSTATLEATGVNGRVILTTGSNPGTVAGVANINGLVTGTQTSNIASGGELSATGGVVLSGQNLISQTNNVTVSAGDYSITAAGKVTLGGTQAAHGVVTIVGHDIAHSGTVSLTANKDGAFSDATAAQGKLSVRATGGSIDLGTDSTIRGGTGHESEVHFETTISGADVTAGHVSGLELTGLENQTGDIITGDIDVDTALTLKTTGGNISTGGITVGGATPQDASVWSTTGDVSVIGDGSISGDYGVTAHGTATLGGTQKAHGTVTVEGADIANSGTLSLTANKDGAFSAGTAAQGKLTLTADTGGIDIGKGSTLNGGTTAGGTPNRLSEVAISAATAGADVTLGNVNALSLTGLTAQAGDISVGDVDVTNDITLATTNGNVRGRSVKSRTGNVEITAINGDISGLSRAAAGDGRLLDTFDRLDLTAAASGKKVTVSASGTSGKVQLGAANAGDGTAGATVADQVYIRGHDIDLASAYAEDGKLHIVADTGAVKIGTSPATIGKAKSDVDVTAETNVTAKALTSTAGSVTVTAGDDSIVTPHNGSIDVGTADAAVDLTMSAYGTASGGDVALGNGEIGHAVNMENTSRGGTAGDVTITGTLNSTKTTVGATDLTSANNIDINVIDSRLGDITLTAEKDIIATLLTAEASSIFATAGDNSVLTPHIGSIGVGTANAHIDLDMSAYGVKTTSVHLASDGGNITLGDGTVGGVTTLENTTRSGTAGEIAVTGTLNSGQTQVTAGSTDLTSAESIRVNDIDSKYGDITLTANSGNITGKASGSSPVAETLGDYGRGDLTVEDTGRTITVQALDAGIIPTGNIQLGALTAGKGDSLSPFAQEVYVTATGSADITSAHALDGGLYIQTDHDATAETLTADKGDIQVKAGNETLVTPTSGSIAVTTLAQASGDLTLSAYGTLANTGNVTLHNGEIGHAVNMENTSRGGTAGDVTITGTLNSTKTTVGATDLTSANNIDVNVIDSRLGDITLTAEKDITATLLTAEASSIFATAGDNSVLTPHAGSIDVGIANAHIDLDMSAYGVKTTSVHLASDGGNITLVDGTVGGVTTLENTTRSGTAGEIAITGTLNSGQALATAGSTDLTSAESIRVNDIDSKYGDITLTANSGNITGKASGSSPVAETLGDYGRGDLTVEDAGKTITVTALDAVTSSNGNIQLGVLTAGNGTLTPPLSSDEIYLHGHQVDITSADATDGKLHILTDKRTVKVADLGKAKTDVEVQAEADVTADTLESTLGSVLVTAGDDSIVTPHNGSIDVGTANAHIDLDMSAYGVKTTSVHLASDGGNIMLGDGTVGGVTTLENTTRSGTAGEIAITGTLNSGQTQVTAGSTDLTSAESIRVNDIDSKYGDITLTANSGNITGKASVLSPVAETLGDYGRGDLTVEDTGRTITVQALDAGLIPTGNIQLGALTAGKGDSLSPVAQEVYVTATGSADITSAHALDGGLYIQTDHDATAETLTADKGDIQVKAGNETLVTPTSGSIAITTLAQASGDLTLSAYGTLANTGNVTLHNGEIGHAVNMENTIRGGTAGDVTITGTLNSTKTTVGATDLTSANNIDINVIDSRLGDITLTAEKDIIATLLTAEASSIFATAGDNSVLTPHAGSIDVGTANAHIDLDMSAYGVKTTSVHLASDGGNITLGDGTVGGVTTLENTTRSGTAGEIAITGTLNSGQALATAGSTDLTSAESIRVNDIDSKYGDITLTANSGNITGKASGSSPVAETLGDYGRGDLTVEDAGKTITVTALDAVTSSNGNIQLGVLTAGNGTLTPPLSSDEIYLHGHQVDITSADATDGKLHILTDERTVKVADLGKAKTDVEVQAQTDVTADTLESTLGSVRVTAGNAVTPHSGSIDVGTAGAQIDLILSAYGATAGTGNITLGTGNAGNAATLENTIRGGTYGDITVNDTLASATMTGGATELASAGNIRLDKIDSAHGDITLTANTGDITGIAQNASPVTIGDYGRGDLTAHDAGKTITVTALDAVTSSNGNIQLGVLTAGNGTLTPPLSSDEIYLHGHQVDITSADATDGKLHILTDKRTVKVADLGKAKTDVEVQAEADVTADTLESTLGSVIVTAGDDSIVTPHSGSIDVATANAHIDLILSAYGATAGTGNITLGTGNAGNGATLENTIRGGIYGDITVNDTLASATMTGGATELASAGNIRLDTIDSQHGDVTLTTLNGDISGLSLSTGAADGRLLMGYDRGTITAEGNGRAITVTASHDVQLGAVNAGDGIGPASAPDQIDITAHDSVDVTLVHARDGGVQVTAWRNTVADTLSADNGNITVTAGNATLASPTDGSITIRTLADAAADLKLSAYGMAAGTGNIVLRDAEAGHTATLENTTRGGTAGDVTVLGTLTSSTVVPAVPGVFNTTSLASANNIRVNTIDSKFGDVTLTAVAGDVTGLAGGGSASDLDPGFGRSVLTTEGRGRTVSVTAKGKVQLASVTAGTGTVPDGTGANQITVTADSVDITSTTAKDGALKIAATGGDVVLTGATGFGGVDVGANNNLRFATINSDHGNVALATTVGDISGRVTTPAASDGRLLAGYDRGTVTAGHTGATLSVTAAGKVQLGALSSGDGSLTTPTGGAGVTVSGRALDLSSVAAKDAAVHLTSTTDDIIVPTVVGKDSVVIESNRNIRTATVTSNAGDVGLTAKLGDLSGLADVTATGDGRLLDGFGRSTVTASGVGRTVKVAAGKVQVDTLSAGAVPPTATTTLARVLAPAVTVDQVTIDGSAIDAVKVGAKNGNIRLTANGGAIALGTGTATGSAEVTTTAAVGDIRIGSLTGASDTVTSSRDVTIDSIASTSGDITVSGGGIGVSSAHATRALTLTGGGIDLGNGTAGGTATIDAVGAARIGSVDSDSDVMVTAATAMIGSARAKGRLVFKATAGDLKLTQGSAEGSAELTTKGGDITVADSLKTGAAMTLDADGALSATSLTSGGDVKATATKIMTLGPVTATGRAVALKAPDATLNGDIAAQAITLTATQALRLGASPTDGDAVPAGGFVLSETELNHLKPSGSNSVVTLDAGALGMAIGMVNWSLPDPASTVNLFTTGRIDLTGRFALDTSGGISGSTAVRTLVLGGSGSDATAKANVIRIAATASGGGRIDIGQGTLDLRGTQIGVGEDEAFLTDIGLTPGGTPHDVASVVSQFVSQPTSPLYRARTIYRDTLLIRAGAMKVEYTNYALFQNTGLAGQNSGVSLNLAAGASLAPQLQLAVPSEPNAFALYGDVNNIGGIATALLGATVIGTTGPITAGNSRVNGCVIGAATACLSTSLIQPPLNVFDNSKVAVLSTVAPDLSFDTGISSSNESLFSDIATPAVQDQPCDPTNNGNCPTKDNP